MRSLRIISLSLILTATGTVANNSGTLLIEPWYEERTPDSIYVALDRLAAAGVIEPPLMSIRPYTRGYIAELLSEGNLTGEGLTPTDERYLDLLKDEFGDELGIRDWEDRTGRPPVYYTYGDDIRASIGGYGHTAFINDNERNDGKYYELIPNNDNEQNDGRYLKLTAVIDGKIDYKEFMHIRFYSNVFGFINREFPPERIGRSRFFDRIGVYGEPRVVYISAGWPNLSFQYGRDHLEVGPGYHNQLLLSRNAPPLDLFRINLSFPKANFTAITARLEPWDDRYLSLHQVVIRVFPWVDVGFAESVIYQDPNFLPVYFNPIIPYYVEQFYRGDLDNMFFGLQSSFYLPRGIHLYGEYMTDGAVLLRDLREGVENLEPFDRRGLLFGGYFPFTLGDCALDARCEYTNVRNTVYSHFIEGNSYTYDDIGLGSYTGPDADEIWLYAGFHYWPNIETSAELTISRKGEGDFSEDTYYSDSKYLTGDVEREKDVALGVLWEDLPLHGAVRLKTGYTWTDNYDHQLGTENNYFWMKLQGKLGFM